MEINRSSRHQKIVGDFGEHLVSNWLSRSGFEVSRVDHTGIDVVAYHPKKNHRYGITVKARTRIPGTETEDVTIFRQGDREKMLSACKAFACEPWLAIYAEFEDAADLFLTSLSNYDRRYRVAGVKIDRWKMTAKHRDRYTADSDVKHIHVEFKDAHWW